MLNQNELDHLTEQVKNNLEKILLSLPGSIPKSLEERIESFRKSHNDIYEGIANNKNEDHITSSIIVFASNALKIVRDTMKKNILDSEHIKNKDLVEKHAVELLNSVNGLLENEQENYYSLNLSDINKVKSRISKLSDELNFIDRKNNQSISDIENKTKELRDELSSLSSKSEKIKSHIEETIDETNNLYNAAIENLNKKEERAQELLQIISRDSISGSYQQSAADERKTANYLRSFSLFFMVLMTIVMGVALWETVSPNFNWQAAAFKITIVMILSIPAAYLARESSRHRELQNMHHSISLELKSVDPYLSSLPDEKRITIKEKLAERIFMGGNDARTKESETPINSQEIIIALLKRLESKES